MDALAGPHGLSLTSAKENTGSKVAGLEERQQSLGHRFSLRKSFSFFSFYFQLLEAFSPGGPFSVMLFVRAAS